ncbi:L domain-like protein [Dioscorea alata]|uniref:L domain-like protein n=1 Tax=Dioscorea alata TaxID=55571 RepID=A0ACB7W1J3_DIOAL|nr:L domain-like protein [Dioscorea alata]
MLKKALFFHNYLEDIVKATADGLSRNGSINYYGLQVGDKTNFYKRKLSSLGLKGTLSGDVDQLTELKSLDLSSNTQLGGSVTPNIGRLTKLTTLILASCSFTGNIPDELGNLEQLSFLALNSNKFTGRLPASLGRLANLYWLDIAENQLTGPLPISRNKAPGLDLLLKTKHFHFNKNQLSGTIPDNLFSSEMSLIHLLLDGNNFTGNIPQSIRYMQSLDVLRLDKNSLKGPVPTNLNNLTKVNELE